MRLDQFLKACCVVKHRTEAKRACEKGVVTVNGRVAKASREMRCGDTITVDSESRLLELQVLGIPPKNVSKKEARDFYHVIRDEDRRLFDF